MTDAVEVKWEANALLAGGRWVTSQEELQTVCSYLRSRADDGVLHLTDEACSAPAEAFGNADFFVEQKLLLIDLCRLGATPCSTRSFSARRTARWTTLRMSAPTVGEVRGNGMLCLIPVPSAAPARRSRCILKENKEMKRAAPEGPVPSGADC